MMQSANYAETRSIHVTLNKGGVQSSRGNRVTCTLSRGKTKISEPRCISSMRFPDMTIPNRLQINGTCTWQINREFYWKGLLTKVLQ